MDDPEPFRLKAGDALVGFRGGVCRPRDSTGSDPCALAPASLTLLLWLLLLLLLLRSWLLRR